MIEIVRDPVDELVAVPAELRAVHEGFVVRRPLNAVTGRWLLARAHVVGHELLEWRAAQTERLGFLHGAVSIPFVDLHALDEPHRGCAVRARTVDVGWLVAGLPDRFEE